MYAEEEFPMDLLRSDHRDIVLGALDDAIKVWQERADHAFSTQLKNCGYAGICTRKVNELERIKSAIMNGSIIVPMHY